MPFMKHCPLRNRQFLPAGHDILIYMEKIKENTIVYKKTANGSPSVFECGRWDLNPHERNAHKILSLARLPVPTLPHFIYVTSRLSYNIKNDDCCQPII